MSTIGARIRQLRKGKKLTQVALAARVGIDQSTLSLLETNESTDMMGNTLARMCQELHTTAEFLMFGITPNGGTATPVEREALQLLRNTSADNLDTAMRSLRAIALPRKENEKAA